MSPAQAVLSRWCAALLALLVVLAPAESFAARAPAAKVGKVVKVKAARVKVAAVKDAKRGQSAGAAKTARKTGARDARKPADRGVRKEAAGARKVDARPVLAAVAPAMPAPVPADPGKLALKASVAYVIDQESGEELLGKNDADVRPIASLTKLMTGLIVSDAGLPLDERIRITDDDVDRLKHSSSRLKVGTELTRREALHLALMSSENRASHALARTYPGGVPAFVSAMNNKARQLGMLRTRYVDPTGLSSRNQSSARDLALLAGAAYDRPLLRKYSTSRGYQIEVAGGRELQYVNTNKLVRTGEWDIGLQKTGYISEAGQCLVVQTRHKGRNLIMVFLDSASKVSRITDAQLVRRWLDQHARLHG